MRAFTREAYEAMDLGAAGMEFASEMVIRAAQLRLRCCEVPVDYYPRRIASKLRPWRDGWRHLRFIMMFFPVTVYWGPGLLAAAAGLFLLLAPLGPFFTAKSPEGALYRQLIGCLLTVAGFQLGTVGLFAKTYALLQGFEHHNTALYRFYQHFNLEKGILLGLLVTILGLLAHWYPTLRHLLPEGGLGPDLNVSLVGLTFAIIGFQILVSSFFLSLMSIKVERIHRGGGGSPVREGEG